ncbi:hypothetical protein [Aquifex sp.]
MREALILLFLLVAYNYILYYITWKELSIVPLFPKDPVNIIIVLSFNITLYLAGLFGERRRIVVALGYLFFFQISLLSFIYRDPYIFVSDLFPVILTFMFVVLFESPFEREKKKLEEEREKLLKELEELSRERKEVEEKIEEYRKQIGLLKIELKQREEELQRAKEQAVPKEEIERREKAVRELEEELKKLEEELKKQREKEAQLLQANRQLFQMLEILGMEEEKKKGSKEVKELRKERKKLVKEVLELQQILDLYDKENRSLRKELEEAKQKIKELQREAGELQLKLEEAKRNSAKKKEVYEEIFKALLPHVEFTKDALEEFIKLPPEKKRYALRELINLSEKTRLEPLTTLPEVFKLKFPGGRIYLKKVKDRWRVVGVLGTEQDKEKERFIRTLEDKL